MARPRSASMRATRPASEQPCSSAAAFSASQNTRSSETLRLWPAHDRGMSATVEALSASDGSDAPGRRRRRARAFRASSVPRSRDRKMLRLVPIEGPDAQVAQGAPGGEGQHQAPQWPAQQRGPQPHDIGVLHRDEARPSAGRHAAGGDEAKKPAGESSPSVAGASSAPKAECRAESKGRSARGAARESRPRRSPEPPIRARRRDRRNRRKGRGNGPARSASSPSSSGCAAPPELRSASAPAPACARRRCGSHSPGAPAAGRDRRPRSHYRRPRRRLRAAPTGENAALGSKCTKRPLGGAAYLSENERGSYGQLGHA